jgi:1-deoxy-D-xylulose-5-phosphate synthase
MPAWRTDFEEVQIGKGVQLLEGEEIAVLSIGHIGNQAIEACEAAHKLGLKPALFDMRFVKPLDEELLHSVFKQFKKVITVEDAAIQGGFGSAIAEFMVDNHYSSQVIRLGIPDEIIEHGEQKELYALCGIDAEGILAKIQANTIARPAKNNPKAIVS